ncbi:tyrosine-type recombinase/integrase [Sporosarcina sp. FSL W7-1283]|uniref:tyrosine-type recombinase/integrase n=1 Tax=Sporosarcina sp. FSL W7-1283 TaxID=2921560 RepID=UPI0030FACF07
MMNVVLIDKFDGEYALRLNIKTRSLYKRFIKEFFMAIGKSYEEVTSRDIRNWLIDLEKEGLAASSRNTRLCGIKLFYRFLREEGLVEKDNSERIPLSKVEEELPYYLEPGQLIELRRVLKKLDDRAIIETLYSTGVRISELIAMKKEDINWPERSIHIPEGKRKKARIVLFTKECEIHLKAYLDSRQDDMPSVFVGRYANTKVGVAIIQRRFREYADQLGIRLTPHTLRHTFAAHLANKGMPLECIQTLLGHEELKQTRHYARLYEHARKNVYDEWT